MPQLASRVEERLDSPTPGEEVTLIVGLENTEDRTLDAVRDTGATVEKELFYDTIRATIDEADLRHLCDSEVVETVEIERTWETMESGTGN